MASEPATTPDAGIDLISFLEALSSCRMAWGIRFPQWWMLLVEIFSIVRGQGSLVGMERFAKRHRNTLNELLAMRRLKRMCSAAISLPRQRSLASSKPTNVAGSSAVVAHHPKSESLCHSETAPQFHNEPAAPLRAQKLSSASPYSFTEACSSSIVVSSSAVARSFYSFGEALG